MHHSFRPYLTQIYVPACGSYFVHIPEYSYFMRQSLKRCIPKQSLGTSEKLLKLLRNDSFRKLLI